MLSSSTCPPRVINLGGTATTGIGYDTSAKYIIPEFAHRDQQLQFAWAPSSSRCRRTTRRRKHPQCR